MNIDEINKKICTVYFTEIYKFRSKLKTSIRKLIFRPLTCLHQVGAKSYNRTGFGRSYGNYRMGPDRIYGKLREITIFRYRDSAPLPVRIRNGRYISYFTHQLDYNKFIYLFILFSHLFICFHNLLVT